MCTVAPSISTLSLSLPTAEEVAMLLKSCEKALQYSNRDYFVRRFFRLDNPAMETKYVQACLNLSSSGSSPLCIKHEFPAFLGVDAEKVKQLSQPQSQTLSVSVLPTTADSTHPEGAATEMQSCQPTKDLFRSLVHCIRSELDTRSSKLSTFLTKHQMVDDSQVHRIRLDTFFVLVGVHGNTNTNSIESTSNLFLPKFLLELETRKQVELTFIKAASETTIKGSACLVL